MTKQYFIELASYNIWANDIVIGWLEKISEEQWNQPIVSSFGNIGATVLHIAGAEKVWLDRFEKVESPVWLPNVYKGGKEELIGIWKKASADLKNRMETFDEKMLSETLRLKRLNGEWNEVPYFAAFAHIFNHSTFHRGQIVTMLRQAGFTGVSSTDMLGYFRKS